MYPICLLLTFFDNVSFTNIWLVSFILLILISFTFVINSKSKIKACEL